MLNLQCTSDPKWIEAVMADFDAFLIDHAACERKASAAALSFVVRYPDRTKLIAPLIEVAREELDHLQQVHALIDARGLQLAGDEKDPYVNALIKGVRNGRETRLLDRLIVAGVLEARGCERFSLVAEALEPGELKDFYTDLTRSEARHHALFIRLARHYFEEDVIRERVGFFLELEAEAISGVEIRSALH